MAKKKVAVGTVPDYESATAFSRGKAASIFKDIVAQDKVLIVNKQNRPQTVIISFERYQRLKEEGADI